MKKHLFKILLLFLIPLLLNFSMPLNISASPDTDVEAFVSRFYNLCLEREPDTAGLNNWIGQLESGKLSGSGVAEAFIFSKEFQSKNISNRHFLNIMYRAFFNRAPDTEGYLGWLSQLENGKSRKFVLEGFVNSIEFRDLCTSYGIEAGSNGGISPTAIDIKDVNISGSDTFNSLIGHALSLLNNYHSAVYKQLSAVEGIYEKSLSHYNASALADLDREIIQLDLNAFSDYGDDEKVKIIAATLSHELNHMANKELSDSMPVAEYERLALEQELETSIRIGAPQWYIDYVSYTLKNILNPSFWWWHFSFSN